MTPNFAAIVPVLLSWFTSRFDGDPKSRPFYDQRSGIAYATNGHVLLRVCGLLVAPDGSVEDPEVAARSDALFEDIRLVYGDLYNVYRAAKIVRKAVEDRYLKSELFDSYDECAAFGLVRIGQVYVQGQYVEKALEAIFASCDRDAMPVRFYVGSNGLVIAGGEIQIMIGRFVLSGPGCEDYLVCDCSTLQVSIGRAMI